MRNSIVISHFSAFAALRSVPNLTVGSPVSQSAFEIPNPKHQITNKSQIPIFNDQNIIGVLFFKI